VVDFPDDLVDVLRNARSVAVLTGAGISAESGIPTFRDSLCGLWAKFDPMQLATPEAFADDPARVTRWYDERRLMVLGCEPNPAHYALVRMEEEILRKGGNFTLITQNVDRLHERAGNQRLLELHGSLVEWRSTRTGRSRIFPDAVPFDDYPPQDGDGGLLRPSVVWFGEMLPEGVMEQAERACRSCDLFMSIGTAGVVYPAAGLIDMMVNQDDPRTKTVEINTQGTHSSDRFDWSIFSPAGDLLPGLVDSAFCLGGDS